MADEALNSFAGGTAHGLVVFLLSWLRKEALFLKGLPREMEKIRKELEFVASFQEGEAERGERGDRVRAWRLQLRDAAHAAEEVMDEYVHYKARSPNSRFVGIREAAFSVATLPEKHQIASRAQLAYKEFEAINERARRYGLLDTPTATPARGGSSHRRSQRSSFPNCGDRPLIGFDQEREALVGLLRSNGERRRVVIGVNGMGGAGKTTLACSAYQEVKSSFDCSAWIFVSQSFSIEDLLGNMTRQIKGTASVNEAMAGQELSDHLKGKKYLIVLDYMRDYKVWHELKYSLPDNDKGSRIIVTTRMERVVSSLGENRRDFKLKPMSNQHAWDLFCHMAFVGKICPQDIDGSARAIVAGCGGLPLAIVTMARLMASRNQTAKEWRNVEERLGWYLSSQYCEEVPKVLLLSFTELPYYLKCCFLYLSIFPEDFVIKKNKLVRLWIAEGFVEEQSGLAPEVRAEEFLEELVSMNLVEASNKVCKRTYRMHHVMRELAMWIAEKERFLMVHDGKQKDPRCRARRLSIQTRGQGSCLECTGKFHLHSILNFYRSCSIELKRMLPHSKFLRVLDLEGLRIDKCPDGVEELFNLRYLSLRKTGIKNLPHGLEKIPNLETLDLRETELQEVPLGRRIKNLLPSEYVHSKDLQKLRYLYVGPPSPSNSGYVVSLGIPPPQGVCEFINLQTLAHIKADETFVTNVGKLTQLKKLGITNVREVDTKKLLLSIMKMTTLRHLSITAAPGQALTLESAFNSSPPTSIQKLMLMGKMRDQKLPKWITSLNSLTLLRLRASKLSDDPLLALKNLRNLEEIELRDAYIGKKLNFPTGSFVKLKKLQLWDLHNLEGITINQGAVPIIREMHFYNCKKLVEAPQHEGERYRGQYDIFTADTSW